MKTNHGFRRLDEPMDNFSKTSNSANTMSSSRYAETYSNNVARSVTAENAFPDKYNRFIIAPDSNVSMAYGRGTTTRRLSNISNC